MKLSAIAARGQARVAVRLGHPGVGMARHDVAPRGTADPPGQLPTLAEIAGAVFDPRPQDGAPASVRDLGAARVHVTDPRALDTDPARQALRPKARVAAESLHAGRDDDASMHRHEHCLGGWHREGEPPRLKSIGAEHGAIFCPFEAASACDLPPAQLHAVAEERPRTYRDARLRGFGRVYTTWADWLAVRHGVRERS